MIQLLIVCFSLNLLALKQYILLKLRRKAANSMTSLCSCLHCCFSAVFRLSSERNSKENYPEVPIHRTTLTDKFHHGYTAYKWHYNNVTKLMYLTLLVSVNFFQYEHICKRIIFALKIDAAINFYKLAFLGNSRSIRLHIV